MSAEFLFSPRSFLLVHCDSCWSIVLVFFKMLREETIYGLWRSSKICLRPSNMASLFIELYCNEGETI
jgi:hypothetical protein